MGNITESKVAKETRELKAIKEAKELQEIEAAKPIKSLQSYRYSLLQRLWLKLESRSLDKSAERLIALFPPLLYMQEAELQALLEQLPQMLSAYLKPHLIQRTFANIVLRLKEYQHNDQLFMQDRQRALELLAEHIQYYAIVLDIFDTNEPNLALIEQVVQKKFDENFALNKASMRILAYQEKYYK